MHIEFISSGLVVVGSLVVSGDHITLGIPVCQFGIFVSLLIEYLKSDRGFSTVQHNIYIHCWLVDRKEMLYLARSWSSPSLKKPKKIKSVPGICCFLLGLTCMLPKPLTYV